MKPFDGKRVVFVQPVMKQYRTKFFELLQQKLSAAGIEISVVYSPPGQTDAGKKDNVDLPSTYGRSVRGFHFFNDRVLWQVLPVADVVQADLIVLVQATGYLHNYPLLALGRLGLKKVAFWGHGYNRQGSTESWSERLKRTLLTTVQWWFAYTPGTVEYLADAGMPRKRITNFQNANDTRGFRDSVNAIGDADIAAIRQRFGIGDTDRVALYCGSLYLEKRVPYLLKTAALLQEMMPEFRLLIIGGGKEADLVRAASHDGSAIVYAGPLFGKEKAACFRLAEIFLNPGAVGLSILDSFAAGLPFISAPVATHGPEIEYLENGVNGLLVDGDEVVFAESVATLMADAGRFADMKQGAWEAGGRYTVENMAEKMFQGICDCLLTDCSRIR